MLQCTSIDRCALFITAKNNINFLFCVHITFLFFILSPFHSPCLSPHCLSISSFFLHRPSLHHRSHKPSRHRPFRFALHSFCFDREGPSHAVGGKIGQLVSVRARFVSEDYETVPLGAALIGRNQNGQGIVHGFWFGCVDFSRFLFCSSLVLMSMAGLWLCGDFYGFDGDCGCMLVVEGNIILLQCLYYFIVLKVKIDLLL